MYGIVRICIVAAALATACVPAMAQDVMLRGTLGGGNVVSATDSPASGEVAAVLGDDGVLRLDLVFADLEPGATGAALHTGNYNENGPMVARLAIDSGATAGRIVDERVTLTPVVAAAVRAGDGYVVISTIEHPDGAVRAQLMPQPVTLDQPPVVGPPRAAPPASRDSPPVEEPEEGEGD